MSPEKKDPFEQLLKNHLSASVSQPSTESCPDENWMAAYLEGSQSEHFKKTFERHLLQCDRCQAEMGLLLKTGVAEAQPKPSALAAEPSPRSNLLALLFDWTRTTAFRPVFALLLVSVVTGVVGYQLLRDERILQERSIGTTESTHRNRSPLADADESAVQSSDDHKRQEQKQSPKSESSPVRREAAQDRLERPRAPQAQPGDLGNKGKTKSQENEMKDAFAAEPPSTVPAESNRDAVGGSKRPDMAVAPQTLPEPLQKESLSAAAVVDRQNSQLQTKADEASAKPKNQVMPAAAPPARPALGALSERKAEQGKLADAEEARTVGSSVKKKQVLVEGPRQAGAYAAAEADAVSHIEAGGKRFELTDNIWKDASILPDDTMPPILVLAHSPEFERRRKQLAPYQLVLSRPEDVLIKLDSRVYRIKKAPKAEQRSP
jgi:hypothetical protein